MDISSKTVTSRVHTAVAKTVDFKDVAILAAKRQLGLNDSAVVSADATVSDDGTITVEVVESVDTDAEAPKGSMADDEAAKPYAPDDVPTPAKPAALTI